MSNNLSEPYDYQTHTNIIRELLDCALVCESCAAACHKEKDADMLSLCITLDHECSNFCLQAANRLEKDSEKKIEFLDLCEKTCRACAEECSRHQHSHCRECAEICLKCAEACHAFIERSLKIN